jgi:hypothetical protein
METTSAKGQILFGIVVAAIGVENLVSARFELKLPGVPWVPVNPFLAYVSGAVFVVAGVCIDLNLYLESQEYRFVRRQGRFP